MGILLTQKDGIIGFIAKPMGFIMNLIFEALSAIGIHNIGLSIILFTIIIYTLMLPIQIKQQKFTKISSVMNVEIREIQKKYQNKKDQASILKMQDETKVVYEKYGTSPMGGCLGSLIQLPFLFALWPVVENIPAYVDKLKDAYNKFGLIDKLRAIDDFKGKGYNKIIDALYKFDNNSWGELANKNPEIKDIIEKTEGVIREYNYFPTSSFGINIAETPSSMLSTAIKDFSIIAIIIAVLIPILAGVTQWMSIKISQVAMDSGKPKKQEDDMVRQMNAMTRFMPLISVFFCYRMPIGLGLYWITSAVVRTIQQVLINKSLNKKSLDDIIKENKEKADKKRAKKKQADPENMSTMAKMYTRKLEEIKSQADTTQQSSSSSKPGSLSARANMVRDFNNRNNK